MYRNFFALIAILLIVSILFSFTENNNQKDHSEYITSFPNSNYAIDASVDQNEIEFTNRSDRAIYEFQITGDSIFIENKEVSCLDEMDFVLCYVVEKLLPGETYQLSVNNSAKGEFTYFAKDAFDSIVVNDIIEI